MAEQQREWQIFIENLEAVIEALRQGECEGILPAARGFLDGFAQFLLEAGILDVLEGFPDGRRRRTIPIFFFCHTLIYRPLLQLKRLAPIERTLFRSAYMLRQPGFNALQIERILSKRTRAASVWKETIPCTFTRRGDSTGDGFRQVDLTEPVSNRPH